MGAFLGCIMSNTGTTAATGGLSFLAGNAVDATLDEVGFGVSLTGEFEFSWPIYDGSTSEVGLKGNIYMYLYFSPTESALWFLPDSMAKYLSLGCNIYTTLQVENGQMI